MILPINIKFHRNWVKLFIINTLPRIILEFSCLLFIVFIALNITSESSFTNIIPILTLIVIAAVRMLHPLPKFQQIIMG